MARPCGRAGLVVGRTADLGLLCHPRDSRTSLAIGCGCVLDRLRTGRFGWLLLAVCRLESRGANLLGSGHHRLGRAGRRCRSVSVLRRLPRVVSIDFGPYNRDGVRRHICVGGRQRPAHAVAQAGSTPASGRSRGRSGDNAAGHRLRDVDAATTRGLIRHRSRAGRPALDPRIGDARRGRHAGPAVSRPARTHQGRHPETGTPAHGYVPAVAVIDAGTPAARRAAGDAAYVASRGDHRGIVLHRSALDEGTGGGKGVRSGHARQGRTRSLLRTDARHARGGVA